MENKKNNRKLSLELFLYFFKIGWYTFGGGWSIIAQIQRDYVDKKHYITAGGAIYLPTVAIGIIAGILLMAAKLNIPLTILVSAILGILFTK